MLNLDGNRLTLLPAEIAGMTALRELWVHDNQLAVSVWVCGCVSVWVCECVDVWWVGGWVGYASSGCTTTSSR